MGTEVKEMVLGFLAGLGLKPQPDDRGIYRIEVPTSERSFFNDLEAYTFTFDRETAQRCREAEFLCEGCYFFRKILERLAATPKVSRLFAGGEIEILDASGTLAGKGAGANGEPGNVVALRERGAAGEGLRARPQASVEPFYRQQLVFTFKVTYEGPTRHEELLAARADPLTGELCFVEGLPDFAGYSEKAPLALPQQDQVEDVLRIYLRTCAEVEQRLQPRLAELRQEAEGMLAGELGRINRYFDEQKAELQQKKENVYFHLYFFQKEEEIERLLRELEAERTRKLRELRQKHAIEASITLINVVVLCLPTRIVQVTPTGVRPAVVRSPRPPLPTPRRLDAGDQIVV